MNQPPSPTILPPIPAEQLAEIREQDRQMQAVLAELAATETLDEQQELADSAWTALKAPMAPLPESTPAPIRRFAAFRARRAARAVRRRLPRVQAPMPRTRMRERREAPARRSAASSPTSSSDPGDPDQPLSFPHGRPADGSRAGDAFIAGLELCERAGLEPGYIACGVWAASCPSCGWSLRISDVDPDVDLHCSGGCSEQAVLAALAKRVSHAR